MTMPRCDCVVRVAVYVCVRVRVCPNAPLLQHVCYTASAAAAVLERRT